MSLNAALRRACLAAVLSVACIAVAPTTAAPWDRNRGAFASPRFEQVWRAADEAVQEGRTGRSWTWGPGPWFDYREFYRQSPHGLRLVQYFDKARMEINDPALTGGPLGGVTNGLLPVELVSGRVKLGDGIGPDQFEQREPAELPVAGDPANENEDAPTYRSFRSVATLDNGYRDPNRVGQRAGATLARNGTTGFRQDLASTAGTDIVAYESTTGHNIPRVFDEFRNAGQVPAIVAFGLPISDPYWIVARVGGQNKDVLVQLFERRVLTYTPSNPPAYRVEMGNVGQHYFRWRYTHLGGIGQPWLSPNSFLDEDSPVITFASKRDAPRFGVYTLVAGSIYQLPLIENVGESLPFSLQRAWDYSKVRTFGDTTRWNGRRQLFGTRFNWRAPFPDTERILVSEANDYHPAVSPDGTKVAFVSERDGNAELYLLNLPRDSEPVRATPTRLTDTTGCASQHPSWLPDGSGLVYESSCLGGNWEIYRATLDYTQDKLDQLSVAALISPRESTRLTGNASDDRFPRVSPDGLSIAFTATRDGNAEIYTMLSDGTLLTRLTTNPAADDAPTWSPDGRRLAFNSNRDGDHEIFVMNRDGSGQSRETDNDADDGYAVWGQ